MPLNIFKKILELGTPQKKGIPLFVVFERNKNGVVKSMHESLDDAKAVVGFGDSIVQYDATKRIELAFQTTELS
jgi:hypothetical protein